MSSRFEIEYHVPAGRCRRAIRGADPVAVGPPRLPRVTRLMALAIRCEHLVRTGAIKDYATLAELGGVSRARISQIMKLIQLAPFIQEALLFLPAIGHGRAPVLLADLLPIAALADWSQQTRRWRTLCAQRHLRGATGRGRRAAT